MKFVYHIFIPPANEASLGIYLGQKSWISDENGCFWSKHVLYKVCNTAAIWDMHQISRFNYYQAGNQHPSCWVEIFAISLNHLAQLATLSIRNRKQRFENIVYLCVKDWMIIIWILIYKVIEKSLVCFSNH